ncbi:MAG: hypothetical protein WD801_11485 [Gemmatimonadaceae bacterium]
MRDLVHALSLERTRADEVYALPEGDEADDLAKERAVREVVEHAARLTREVTLAQPIRSYRSRPFVLATLALASLIFCAYTYVERPPWIFGQDPARSAPAQREAHLRFAMFLVAQRLMAHQATHDGALPETLLAVGEHWPTISYEVGPGPTFTLSAQVDAGQPISYRSTDDLPAFLGQSARHLREQRP